jgi:MoxR-like ATPase
MLLAKVPSEEALVPGPMFRAMQDGMLCRIEELTRIPSEVQDTLITMLSEKTLPIPELATEIQGTEGFNVIATANSRERGVNELSSALQRRFNTVILPLPSSLEEEVEIVQTRVASMSKAFALPAEPPALDEIRRVVTIFRELRSGSTKDGKSKVKSPSTTLSTAKAISVMTNGLSLVGHFRTGKLTAHDLAADMV